MDKEVKKPSFIKRDIIVNGDQYHSFISSLKQKYRKVQIKAAVKVNTEMLEFYWEIGRDISQLKTKAKWGSAFFECISLDMKAEFPGEHGFSSRNIRYVYDWYTFYTQEDKILQRLIAKLDNQDQQFLQRPVAENLKRLDEEIGMPVDFGLVPWGQHIDIFTRSHSIEEALFYIEETIKNNWSRPEVNLAIDEDLYTKKGKAITNFKEKLPAPFSGLAKDILKSPYDFSFIDSAVDSEKSLEDALARDITRFLLELGTGFSYVGRQMQLQMPGGKTYIPDMIFYHYRLKSFIICELKYSEFKPEFAGKLNFYVSAVDELLKGEDDNPTIGLLICKSKDNTEVEWAFRGMSQPLGVASFELKAARLLPTAEQLQQLIETYHPSKKEQTK